MYLENLVFDTADPGRLGRFWTKALGLSVLTDEDDAYEARLAVPDGPTLDLCFQPVEATAERGARLHLDLAGGAGHAAVVARLLRLGARPLDIGPRDVPWVVLADPEANAFCVVEEREAYADTGPLAAIPIDSADPPRDAAFWAALAGWVSVDTGRYPTLRHPSRRGPLLVFCPEPAPKTAKNRLHLDLRLESADDRENVLGTARSLGATPVDHDWGDLPWTVLLDPSGNEFCILPAHPTAG